MAMRRGGALSVVFTPGVDLATAIRRNDDVNFHRLATHLAILDILLLLERTVDQDRDGLTAVRTVDADFLEQVHDPYIARNPWQGGWGRQSRPVLATPVKR